MLGVEVLNEESKDKDLRNITTLRDFVTLF